MLTYKYRIKDRHVKKILRVHANDRDVNAAQNILALARSATGLDEESRRAA